MSIYKLTCSETGNYYYGSTGNDIKVRKNKGWNSCACKNFINPTIEIMEYVKDKNERLKRENDYILNNECININRALGLTQEQYNKIHYQKNGEKNKEPNKEYRKKIVKEKKFHCELCDLSFQAPSKLIRHNEGFRHKLKQDSFNKYGDNWKEHYFIDNKKRYNKNRNIKNKNK